MDTIALELMPSQDCTGLAPLYIGRFTRPGVCTLIRKP